MKSKLAQKLFDENVWQANISKPSVIQFCVHSTSFIIFILANRISLVQNQIW